MIDVTLSQLDELADRHNVNFTFKRRGGDVMFNVYDRETGERIKPRNGQWSGLEVHRQ